MHPILSIPSQGVAERKCGFKHINMQTTEKPISIYFSLLDQLYRMSNLQKLKMISPWCCFIQHQDSNQCPISFNIHRHRPLKFRTLTDIYLCCLEFWIYKSIYAQPKKMTENKLKSRIITKALNSGLFLTFWKNPQLWAHSRFMMIYKKLHTHLTHHKPRNHFQIRVEWK